MSDLRLRLNAQKRILRWPGLNPSTTLGMVLSFVLEFFFFFFF